MSQTNEFISISKHEAVVESSVNEAVSKLTDKIEYLKYKLEQANHQLYGSKTEKLRYSSEFQQPELFDAPDNEALSEEVEEELEEVKAHRRRKPAKARFPKDAERIVNNIELTEAERSCQCCGDTMADIGYDSSEKAELIPARILIREDRRHKYACTKCKEAGVTQSPPAPTAFPKTWITDNTRAHLLVSKFVDHQPYYRQSKIYKRMNVELADSSMVRYGMESADALAPVVSMILNEIVETGYIQADETTISVLKTRTSKPGAHVGYLWGYSNPGNSVVFMYEYGRGAKYPDEVLNSFQGILQTDRYVGYANLQKKPAVIDLACWAHARRKFKEASKYAKRKAGPVLKLIGKLYKIESRAREEKLPWPLRAQMRREEATPLLKDIEHLLCELARGSLTKTPLGDAVNYALNHWDALNSYVAHGKAEIDNNLIENSMRPIALGRKNYMFAGSEGGAEAAATIYSITESCRRLGIDPTEYLKFVFKQLAVIDPKDESAYRKLTPAQYAAQKQ